MCCEAVDGCSYQVGIQVEQEMLLDLDKTSHGNSIASSISDRGEMQGNV